MDWFTVSDSARALLRGMRRELDAQTPAVRIYALLDDYAQGDLSDVTDRARRAPIVFPWQDDPELGDPAMRDEMLRHHFKQTLPALDTCDEATLWVGNLASEQCALRYAVHRLAAHGAQIWLVHVDRMPFSEIPAPQPIQGVVGILTGSRWKNRLLRLVPQAALRRICARKAQKDWSALPKDGEKVFRSVGECGPEVLPYFYAKRRLLDADAIRALSDEWHTLARENAPLRVFENDAVRSAPADYYDEAVLAAVPAEPASAALTVGRVLSRLPVGDMQVFCRIRALARQDRLCVVQDGATYRDMIICQRA